MASGDRSETLRQQDAALAAKSRAAVLSLYAIETKLAAARTQLATIRGQAESIRRERRLVAARMLVARRGVSISQGRLAARLRGLYERGDVDPLAIVLGSESLDQAITGLDSLGQMVNADRAIVEQLRGARTSLAALQQRLADRQRRLDRLVASAAASAASLEQTRASRSAYVAQLAGEQRMTQTAIARVAEQARAARVKAQTLELASATPAADAGAAQPDGGAAPPTGGSAPDAPPAGTDADRTAAAPAPGARTITVTATGYALPGRTATGIPVGWGVAAVDPSVIPLGTRFTVPGYGEAVAADVGGSVRGATVDLWFPTTGQAHGWGRRTVTIVLR